MDTGKARGYDFSYVTLTPLQAKKYNLENAYSNYSSILTYNETGAVDYTYLFDDFENAYTETEQSAGYILSENLQDRTARAGLSLSGWKPKLSDNPMAAQAVEWFMWGMYSK